MAAGDKLAKAQKAEYESNNRYCEHRTPELLEEWKAARGLVETLAELYLMAVRKWRESIETRVGAALEARKDGGKGLLRPARN